MRIELALLSSPMSLLPNGIFSPTSKTDTCEFLLSHCKKSAARSKNSALLQDQIFANMKAAA